MGIQAAFQDLASSTFKALGDPLLLAEAITFMDVPTVLSLSLVCCDFSAGLGGILCS